MAQTDPSQDEKGANPLNPRAILAGIIVAVLGGVLTTWFVGIIPSPFSPRPAEPPTRPPALTPTRVIPTPTRSFIFQTSTPTGPASGLPPILQTALGATAPSPTRTPIPTSPPKPTVIVRPSAPLRRGDAAPAVVWRDIDGRTFDLKRDLAGGPVVFVFYHGYW